MTTYFQISLPSEFTSPAALYVPSLAEKPSVDSLLDTRVRSYDSEGVMLYWNPSLSVPFACDVEYLSRPTALLQALREKFDVARQDDFLRRWVVTEVLAKLYDVPIVVWIQQHGLSLRLEPEQTHILGQARLFLTERQGRAMAFGFLEGF